MSRHQNGPWRSLSPSPATPRSGSPSKYIKTHFSQYLGNITGTKAKQTKPLLPSGKRKHGWYLYAPSKPRRCARSASKRHLNVKIYININAPSAPAPPGTPGTNLARDNPSSPLGSLSFTRHECQRAEYNSTIPGEKKIRPPGPPLSAVTLSVSPSPATLRSGLSIRLINRSFSAKKIPPAIKCPIPPTAYSKP